MNSSAGNIMRMQQEAAERVKRMQEQSRRLVRDYPVHVYRGTTLTPAEAPAGEPTVPEILPPETEQPSGDESASSFGNGSAPLSAEATLDALFHGDQEQWLVLLLAVVLAKSGAPLELVLALLYVAM